MNQEALHPMGIQWFSRRKSKLEWSLKQINVTALMCASLWGEPWRTVEDESLQCTVQRAISSASVKLQSRDVSLDLRERHKTFDYVLIHVFLFPVVLCHVHSGLVWRIHLDLERILNSENMGLTSTSLILFTNCWRMHWNMFYTAYVIKSEKHYVCNISGFLALCEDSCWWDRF